MLGKFPWECGQVVGGNVASGGQQSLHFRSLGPGPGPGGLEPEPQLAAFRNFKK